MKRYLLQKLSTGSLEQTLIQGYMLSEKKDGLRLFWDGGATRGWRKADVPWANTKKDSRFVAEQYSTGLWTQDGHPIYAPDSWLDKLPKIIMEGELDGGRGQVERVTGIARKQVAVESEWKDIIFAAFDTPNVHEMLGPGRVSFRTHDVMFNGKGVDVIEDAGIKHIRKPQDFRYRDAWLRDNYEHTIAQTVTYSCGMMKELFAAVTSMGGEGIVAKALDNFWTPNREKYAFKVVPALRAEVVVCGMTAGNDGKTGRLTGLIGALKVRGGGKVYKVSGLTDEQRQFATQAQSDWARACPGEDCPKDFEGKYFKLGDVITIEYKELTAYGVPKTGRYKHHRDMD